MERKIPISVNDLIRKKKEEENSLKPRFLSNRKREQLKILQKNNLHADNKKVKPGLTATKRQLEDETEEGLTVVEANSSEKANEASNKRRKEKKFNFEWEEDEDTSLSYKPLITYDFTGNNITSQLSKKVDWNDKHWTQKPLDKMKDRDWRILKEDYNIASKGGQVDNPLRYWEEAAVQDKVIEAIYALGYKEPTPIQRAAIPCALNNRDIVGIAETGSGKTASFLIPLISYILKLPPITEINRNDGPYGLVIAPTRELAQQIEKEAKKFCSKLNIFVTSIVGGHSFEETVHNIRNGIHIVIATPGRLVDSLERHIIQLNQCYYLIMDEADRMIDMGFEAQVGKIMESLPPIESNSFGLEKRQTMMFTATMPPTIEKITRNFLTRPATLLIGNIGDAADTVVQEVEFINSEDKRKKRMIEILSSSKFGSPIIIFVNFKKSCDIVFHELSKHGFKSAIMHGSKTQEQREHALNQLRNGKVEILVATDLAGRGIDIPNVSLVLNFQMSKNVEDYTHRIGRTGRAGKRGTSITFLGDEDGPVLYNLKRLMMKSSISKIPNELRSHPAAQMNTFKE